MGTSESREHICRAEIDIKDKSEIILKVDQDDGSESFYKLSSRSQRPSDDGLNLSINSPDYISIASKMNNLRFYNYINGIGIKDLSDNNIGLISSNSEIGEFIGKLRYGNIDKQNSSPVNITPALQDDIVLIHRYDVSNKHEHINIVHDFYIFIGH